MVAPTASIDLVLGLFLPDGHLAAESDAGRRGRLVVLFSLVVFAAASAYGLVFLALGMTIAAAGSMVASALSAAAALSLRRGVDARACGHLDAAGAFGGLVLVVLGSGGAHAVAITWLVLPIVVGTMISGRRAGVGWAAAAVGYVALLIAVDGPTVASLDQVPEWFQATYGIMVRTGLLLCLLAIVLSFELAREHVAELARKASEQLEVARHEAEEAHEEVREVLDSVNQGLVLVELDGRLARARSAQLEAWFGGPDSAAFVWDLFRQAPAFAEWLEVSWLELQNDWMPLDIVLEQLPNEIEIAGEHFQLAFRPIADGDQILLVVTSITAELEARRAREVQDELLELFVKVTSDPDAVREFVLESQRQVALVQITDDDIVGRRALHTLKGNCGMFGMTRLARWLHELEDEVLERGQLDSDLRGKLRDRWISEEERLAPLVPDPDGDWVRVPRAELEAAQELARTEDPTLVEAMERWTWDDVPSRLARLADRTRAMARRLGRDGVEVRVEADAIRVPPTPAWRELWNVAVHLVRNALDHGIEPPDEREAAGKAPVGTVTLRAVAEGAGFVLSIADDGRGIDWTTIADRARSRGLPSDTALDLERALFADGVTSREAISEVSGRGVGTSAVWSACEALNGTISVQSAVGTGTCFRLDFGAPVEADQKREVVAP